MNFSALGGVVDNVSLGQTQKNVPFLKFTIVTEDPHKTYHPCISWGKNADIHRQIISEGAFVFVTGTTTRRTYQGNDGSNKLAVETKVDTCMLVGSEPAQQEPEPTPQNSTDPFPKPKPDDDDLPF